MTGPMQGLDYINVLGVHNFTPPKEQWTIILRFIWTSNLTVTSVRCLQTIRIIYASIS